MTLHKFSLIPDFECKYVILTVSLNKNTLIYANFYFPNPKALYELWNMYRSSFTYD